MNGLKYLLDTNIIIGLLKGNDAVIPVLRDISLTVCGFSAIIAATAKTYGIELLTLDKKLAAKL